MKLLHEKSEQRYKNFLKRYEVIGKMGEGAYGVVTKARLRDEPDKFFAIKKFHGKSREGEGIQQTVIREINLLCELSHVNVLKCREVIFGPNSELIMVMECGQYNLEHLIDYHSKMHIIRGEKLPPIMPMSYIRSFMYQLLKGTEYLHQNFIIHRDLKPANLIIHDNEKERGILKIADFGLSRSVEDPVKNLSDDGPVITIWYRPPELILGARHYTPAVDIWSIGCILGEMLIGRPLFRGTEVKIENNPNPFQDDQYENICALLGAPNTNNNEWDSIKYLKEYQDQMRNGGYKKFLKYNTDNLNEKFKKYDSNTIELLRKLLIWDPQKRISATDALKLPFFTQHTILPEPFIESKYNNSFPEKFTPDIDKKRPYQENPQKREDPNPLKKKK